MEKKSDKSRILINSIILSSATVFNNVVFLIINIIVARYLSVEHFGEYITSLGYATFFSTFANIGINQTLVRAVNLESHREREHFANALIIKTALAILVYTAMTVSLYFTSYNRNTIYLTLIFGFVRIGNEYLSAFYSLYEAKERFFVSSLFSFTFALSFLTGTWLVIIYKGNYFHFAYVRLFTVVTFISIIALYTLKNLSLMFDKATLKNFVQSAIPFSLATIYGNIRQRISIIILSLMQGTRATGIFNNGAIFFTTLSILPGSFTRALLPYLYKASFTDERSKFQFSFDIFSKAFGIISFYLFLFFFLFSDTLIIEIFGEKYRESITILRIIAFGMPFLFNFAGTIIIALDMTKHYTRYLGIAALATIIGNLVFIEFFQTEGAAIALVITNFIIFFLTHRFLYKKQFISLKKVIIIYMNLILISLGCCVLYFTLLFELFFMYSFIIISLVYMALVIALLIRSDDIRIIQEALGLRRKEGN